MRPYPVKEDWWKGVPLGIYDKKGIEIHEGTYLQEEEYCYIVEWYQKDILFRITCLNHEYRYADWVGMVKDNIKKTKIITSDEAKVLLDKHPGAKALMIMKNKQ